VRTIELPATDVRLSASAAEALADERPVVVTRYGKRSHVVLTSDQFALVEPLLEFLEEGRTLPAELMMTNDDLALQKMLAEDREPSPGELALVDAVIADL
jgi:PHD/YefM family antitoxin component YafN of YafNO toxin-antitoxin module